MDKRRATRIAASPIMADVTYNGSPVYIVSVNGDRATANIHYINKSDDEFEVSLNNLLER